MKRAHSIAATSAMVATLIIFSVAAFAQTAQDEPQGHHPAAQSQTAENPPPPGAGMMGGKQMMSMPMMMPYCPCAMMGGGMTGMGMGMMAAGGTDPRTAAKMMQMHAEMMKAAAGIMEKYARELEPQK